MVANPRVNQVPVMIGGDGKEELHEFYAKYFLPQIPPDTEMVPVSRTIGQGRLVDEMVIRFTHTIPMDWMLPGIPPTGKRVEVAMLVVVQFEGDKLAHEHLYWDQASVLVQLGLLQPSWSAGRRRRGRAISARSKHTAKRLDSPRKATARKTFRRSPKPGSITFSQTGQRNFDERLPC